MGSRPGALEAAVESMIELNRAAADAIRSFEPSAVTDVTGFGLLGHTYELASRSGVRAVIDADTLPSLPAAVELAADGVRTGGDGRNREYAGPHVESRLRSVGGARLRPADCRGLLASMPSERAAVLEATLAPRGSGRSHRASRGRLRSALPLVAVAVARARSVSARTFPDRSRVVSRALPRHHLGCVRPPDGARAGCENWPSCGDKPYRSRAFMRSSSSATAWWRSSGSPHARDLARVAVDDRSSRWGRWAALGLSRRDRADPDGRRDDRARPAPARRDDALPPRLAAFGLALVAVLEAWSLRDGLAPPAGPGWLRSTVTWVGLPVCITSSLPAPSRRRPVRIRVERGRRAARGRDRRHRLRARAGGGRLRNRRPPRRLVPPPSARRVPRARPHLDRLLTVLVAQAILGEVQYRNALPWGLVLVHVVLAAAIWASASRSRSPSGARPSR